MLLNLTFTLLGKLIKTIVISHIFGRMLCVFIYKIPFFNQFFYGGVILSFLHTEFILYCLAG